MQLIGCMTTPHALQTERLFCACNGWPQHRWLDKPTGRWTGTRHRCVIAPYRTEHSLYTSAETSCEHGYCTLNHQSKLVHVARGAIIILHLQTDNSHDHPRLNLWNKTCLGVLYLHYHSFGQSACTQKQQPAGAPGLLHEILLSPKLRSHGT
jgi:hypothetical protein